MRGLARHRPVFQNGMDEGIYFDQAYQETEHLFGGLFPFLGKMIKLVAMGSLLLFLSVASYGIFYRQVMPSRCATEPLFFDYSGTSAVPLRTFFQPRKHKELELAPWASVDLFAKNTPWEAVHPGVLPSPVAQDRLLHAKQAYFIELALILPESDVNHNVGMFSVVTELYSSNGTKLAVSRRSARLPHESHWVEVLRKVLWIVPLIIGAVEESRTVIVPAFRYYVEDTAHPLVRSLQDRSSLNLCLLPSDFATLALSLAICTRQNYSTPSGGKCPYC